MPQAHKRDLLAHLIKRHDWQQVLVFTRTKHGANKLAEKLIKDGITAAAIHGNKSQSARTKALASFKDGSVRVLVATDIAARGIDIDQLPQVVNFELPNVPEDYVHRIGRTGRAGTTGSALSLVDDEEIGYLRDIEKLIKRSIVRVEVEGFTPPPKSELMSDERPHARRKGAVASARRRTPGSVRVGAPGRRNRVIAVRRAVHHPARRQRAAQNPPPGQRPIGPHRIISRSRANRVRRPPCSRLNPVRAGIDRT